MSRRSLVVTAGAVVVALLGASLNLWRLADAPLDGGHRALRAGDRSELVEPPTEEPGPRNAPLHRLLVRASNGLPGSSPQLANRIPSAILALLLTLAVYLLAATESRIRCGWLAAAALASSPWWLSAARGAEPDMSLAFFVAGSVMSFAMIERDGPQTFWRLAFWLSTLGGTLIAGPVGLALPLAVIAAYAGGGRSEPGAGLDVRGRVQRIRKAADGLALRSGLAAVVALALLGHGLAGSLAGPDLRAAASGRLTDEALSRVPVLLAALGPGILPWCLIAPAVMGWLRQDRPLHGLPRLATIWVGIGLLAFLIGGDPALLLASLPAAALLFGLVLGPGPEGTRLRRWAAIGWILGAVPPLGLGILGLAAVLLPGSEAPWLPALPATAAARVVDTLAILRESPVTTATTSAIAVVGALLAAIQARGAHWLRASVPLVAALAALFVGLRVPVQQAEAGRGEVPAIESPGGGAKAGGR